MGLLDKAKDIISDSSKRDKIFDVLSNDTNKNESNINIESFSQRNLSSNPPKSINKGGLYYKLQKRLKDGSIADSYYFLYSTEESIAEVHEHNWIDPDSDLGGIAKPGYFSTKIFSAVSGGTNSIDVDNNLSRIISANSIYSDSGTFTLQIKTAFITINDPINDVMIPAITLRNSTYGHLNGGTSNATGVDDVINKGIESGSEYLDKFTGNKDITSAIKSSITLSTLSGPPSWFISIGNDTNWFATYGHGFGGMNCTKCDITWNGPFKDGIPMSATVEMGFVSAQKVHGAWFGNPVASAKNLSLDNFTDNKKSLLDYIDDVTGKITGSKIFKVAKKIDNVFNLNGGITKLESKLSNISGNLAQTNSPISRIAEFVNANTIITKHKHNAYNISFLSKSVNRSKELFDESGNLVFMGQPTIVEVNNKFSAICDAAAIAAASSSDIVNDYANIEDGDTPEIIADKNKIRYHYEMIKSDVENINSISKINVDNSSIASEIIAKTVDTSNYRKQLAKNIT